MKVGYYVQGVADEAVVRGLADRWCPGAEFAAGPFRGSSGESFRREIRNVARAPLKSWIGASDSFADFHDEARRLARRTGCAMPNERQDGVRQS